MKSAGSGISVRERPYHPRPSADLTVQPLDRVVGTDARPMLAGKIEFCHISEPLLIGLCGIKLPVQKVLGKILRVLRLSGAATVVIFHGRAYISGPADAEHPFVIDMDFRQILCLSCSISTCAFSSSVL